MQKIIRRLLALSEKVPSSLKSSPQNVSFCTTAASSVTIENMRRWLSLLFCLGLLCVPTASKADGPAFDLAGPKIDVHVKRGEVTLPVAQAANLLPGDRLWVHPDFPENQSNRFVLIIAFLRGATNQPPLDWFTRVETWTHQAREEGVFITVPPEAQQALLFLAPETSGDFATLRKAVHDRPGVFVRASQDLEAASWDRMRLENYLTQVRASNPNDPKLFKERAELSARSLGIKIDQSCFERPADQQATCLTQHTDGMVLDDSNAQALVNQVMSGSTTDLMNQISYSRLGGGGAYSPYIGAIVDTARILGQLHTARFQYIPALALPNKDTLNLRLNMPPSFRDPKSVVVVPLPPVGPSKAPGLHPAANTEMQCAAKPGMVFPAEGAPMVFGTEIAHQLHIHIDTSKGAVDFPVTPDPAKGGLIPDNPLPPLPPGEFTAILRGKWGFDDWDGPHFKLYAAGAGKWTVPTDDQTALIVGRDDIFHIQGDSNLCVSSIDIAGTGTGGSNLNVPFKPVKTEALELSMPMKHATPGPMTLEIHQYGIQKPDTLTLRAYSEAASLERLTFSAGDRNATLKGTRLDEVAKVSLGGVTWIPSALSRVQDFDQLSLKTDNATADLQPGSRTPAAVQLRDGRELRVPVHIDAPRPQVTLLSKGMQDDGSTAPSPVKFGSTDDLPLSGKLVFFLKSLVPQRFPRSQTIEVAAEDGSFHTILTLSDGLMLEDARTAIGTVEPLARFGASAFGPIHARAVSAESVTGDWMPLGTLVRLPAFKELRCPRAANKPCILTAGNLFLVEALAAAPDFSNAVDIPADFTQAQIAVPHPASGGTLYFKLRDDPNTVQTLNLPVIALGPAVPASLPAEKPAQPDKPAAPADKPATEPAPAPSPEPATQSPPSTAPPS